MTYEALEMFKSLFLSGTREPPTTSEYARHLGGETPLSVCTEGSKFSCAKIADGEVPADSPLVVMRGTDGTFAFLFFKRRTQDGDLQLRRVLDYYAPKYDVISGTVLPFFGSSLERLCPVDPGGGRFFLLEEALEFLLSKAVDIPDLDEWEGSLPYQDAPFCVQSHFLSTGELPDYAGAYLDSRRLPMRDREEADRWSRFTYPMDCEAGACRCDRERCSKRKYGCNSPMISSLEFGRLTQFNGATTFYVWEINGKEVRFDSEVEIMRQERFMPICMREIGHLPRKLSADFWLRVINKALSHMSVVGGGGSSELTTEKFLSMVVGELRKRTLVSTYLEHERLMQGWLYLDPTSSVVMFEPSSLCAYIRGRHHELEFGTLNDFLAVARHAGFRGRKRTIDGVERTLMYIRSEFLFDRKDDWDRYMLDVAAGTMWEANVRAFVTGDPEGVPPLDEETAAEVDSDVAVFLDTEKGVENGNGD